MIILYILFGLLLAVTILWAGLSAYALKDANKILFGKSYPVPPPVPDLEKQEMDRSRRRLILRTGNE